MLAEPSKPEESSFSPRLAAASLPHKGAAGTG